MLVSIGKESDDGMYLFPYVCLNILYINESCMQIYQLYLYCIGKSKNTNQKI